MRLPFVISIPHCSGQIPDPMKPAFALSNDEIGESVDWGTREIFGSLKAEEILSARWSRLVVDLNRDPGRRDEKGVVAGVDYFGRCIYRQGMAPDENEINSRLREYFWPYYHRLRKALDQSHIKGLIDCHSLNGVGPSEAPDAGRKRKDIVLSNNGDHNGEMNYKLGRTTCPVALLNLMKHAFIGAGFSVSINDPYSAGFITTHYGHAFTERGKFAVQIEINQDLFTEPGTGKILPEKLAATGSKIRGCFSEIAKVI